jgi:hypothetical protein
LAAFGRFAAVGDRLAALGFVALVLVALAAFSAAGEAVAAGVSAVRAGDVVGAGLRPPPTRAGRVERRLPRTLASAPVFSLFFDFFLADFCVMARVNAQSGQPPALTSKNIAPRLRP